MANMDDVAKIKALLSRDLQIVQDFEDLLKRHGVNGNGNGAAALMSIPSASASAVRPMSGVNTGLADKLVDIVNRHHGIKLGDITDRLLESGYHFSTRDNLKASISQSLTRQVEKGRLRRENGLYYPGDKK